MTAHLYILKEANFGVFFVSLLSETLVKTITYEIRQRTLACDLGVCKE